MSEWLVPFYDLKLTHEEEQAVIQTIQSNWLTSGPRIEAFEKAFAARHADDVHGVAVSSATAALHLSLLTLDLQEGDEVIVPSLTFVATANAVRYVGATPVFADITSKEDWNISPEDIERKITPKTKAMVAVHYAGFPCDMGALVEICKKHDLELIEDCAHAPCVNYEGTPLGSFGHAGCFSFFSNKNITCGEGGMILTRDAERATHLRSLRSHGITASTYQRFKGHQSGYDVEGLGFNYRMDEIRAAIASVQLGRYPALHAQRKALYHRYVDALQASTPDIRIPFAQNDTDSAYHIFPVLLPEGTDQAKIIAYLKERGVQTSIHYTPVHQFTAFAGYKAEVRTTEAIAPLILTLPFYPTMTHAQIETVVKTLKRALAL